MQISRYFSKEQIQSGNAYRAAQARSAAEYMSPGQQAMPGALQQLAQGMDRLGAVVTQEELRKRNELMELDLLKTVQGAQDRYQAFMDDFQQNYQGRDAIDAEAAARTFFENDMRETMQPWQGNRKAEHYLQQHLGGAALAGVGRMRDYGNQQQDAYFDSEAAAQKLRAQRIMLDPNADEATRSQALYDFTRMNNYRYARKGLDPRKAREENIQFLHSANLERLKQDVAGDLADGNAERARARVDGYYKADMAQALEYTAGKESNGDGAAIGYDRKGGTSYGKWQISSAAGTMDGFLKYLDKEAPDIASRLRAAGPANTGGKDGAMPEVWRQISGGEDAERFTRLQRVFIEQTHVRPLLDKLPDDARQAVANNPSMLNVVASTAVQHGPGDGGGLGIVRRAWEKSGGEREGFITEIYAERARQFPGSDEATRKAVIQRLERERNESLAAPALQPVEYMALRKTIQAAERGQEVEARAVAAESQNAFALYQETGDASYLDELEARLARAGTAGAEELVSLRKQRAIYKEFQPYYKGTAAGTFEGQTKDVESWFKNNTGRHNAAAMLKAKNSILKQIAANREAFVQDPAGYDAQREKSLRQGNASGMEARLTLEQSTAASMGRQRELGAGIPGFVPQPLPKAAAQEMNSRWFQEQDNGKRGQMLVEWSKGFGIYAGQAFAQAKLPDAAVAVAQVGQHLPPAVLSGFVASALAKSGELPAPTEETRGRLRDSRMLAAMRGVSAAMYSSREEQEYAHNLSKAFEHFVRAGGDLSEIEKHFLIINDGNMHIVAPAFMGSGVEDALKVKTAQLLEQAAQLSFPLPPEAAGTLQDVDKTALDRNYQFSVRKMLSNGRWIYDGTDGFVLVDAATGRVAPGPDGQAIRVAKGEVSALAGKKSQWNYAGMNYPGI